mmetsp:Transcript_10438/g.11910  ORF Transcript_10438/g.11910 Transcript_10438/m.11910 type:complete len:111 (+) Transcript_10438:353-685(+)
MLIGNKSDLVNSREITHQEALDFATENKLSYLETSAKDNKNVKEAFSLLLNNIVVTLKKLELKSRSSHSIKYTVASPAQNRLLNQSINLKQSREFKNFGTSVSKNKDCKC